jgi:hypothetical protein
MEYLLIYFFIGIVGLILFLIFKICKWILSNRIRRFIALGSANLILLLFTINKLFFEKMEFIQSNIYPNLFLIKHPIKDRDSIDKLIESMVIKEIEKQRLGKNNAFKIPNRNTIETIKKNDKTIHFYLYSNEWGFKNGTVYFIDHEEDPGGFTTEVLTDYNVLKLAYFKLDYCKNDTTKIVGGLSYFKEGEHIKIDTLINNCIEN